MFIRFWIPDQVGDDIGGVEDLELGMAFGSEQLSDEVYFCHLTLNSKSL